MTFRKLPKVSLQIRIPQEIAEELSVRAARQHKPHNEAVAEVLCLGLGLDHLRFGIRPGRRERATSAN